MVTVPWPISYRFRDIDTFCSKIACFSQCHPTLVSRPLAEERPAISTESKHSWTYIEWATIPSLTIRVYLHSFSCCWLSNLRNLAKFRDNSSYTVQGHPRSSISVSIESAYATSYHRRHIIPMGVRDFLTFFPLGSGGQTPQRTFTQNGSNDVYSRKDVPFAVKSLLFIPPDLQAP